MSSDLHTSIRNAFAEAEKILLVSHIRPDGDAIGSLLGLGLALQAAGKTVQMALSDGVPHSFRYLEGSDQVVHTPKGQFDLVVTLDASDLQRLGSALNGYSPDINIDHHVTNLNFARINLVEADTPATAAVLAKHIPEWGLEISRSCAEALLSGIITDTLGFRTSNMDAETLRLSAQLMELGADLPRVYRFALINRTYAEARYWGVGLSGLQLEDRLVWTTLSQEERIRVGYRGNDDADLNNVLSSIQDADISVLFIEQTGGSVKVSWRAQPGIDVSGVAASFGGGGHTAAAGADIPGTLAEVQERVLASTRLLLSQTGV